MQPGDGACANEMMRTGFREHFPFATKENDDE